MLDYVWYASYGSNLHADRLSFYIEGGTPPGTDHLYPGMRDRTPPLKTQALNLPGSVYFAWESPVWTGGVAFYAPDPPPGWPTGAAARGYLLTAAQFSDLQTQEMYREPGPELDLTEVLRTGRSQLGPGRYETLVHADDLDGWPVLTFTSPWDPYTVALNKPSARYLRMVASGLHESHEWSPIQILSYLSDLPGIEGNWGGDELRLLLSETLETGQ
ncbi:histone deacetylase [Nocardia flavorosea]|uniref:histone deacetylase n=1 Tax=Nocardia flavorosea TaxID=53429 RepID=UPI0024590829|nr:histone deacetylase [Nocardia flavorosea]